MNSVFDKEKWSEVIDALSAKPMRTVVTAFGVFWGILILIVLLSASKGLENGIMSNFKGIATNTMFIWTSSTSKPYKGFSKGREFNYNNNDVRVLKEKFPDLELISPRNQLGRYGASVSVVRGTISKDYRVYGDVPDFILQEPMEIRKGRFINAKDIEDKRKIAVIGTDVERAMFKNSEETIGGNITINGVNFLVVGVYYKDSSFGSSTTNQEKVFTPITTFQQVFNYGEDIGWMALTAKEGVPITDLKESILSALKELHTVHPDDERAIGGFDLYKKYKMTLGLSVILQAIAYFVGVLVLLSGVIGVSNIMIIVVKERTQEIGIRRAIGASPKEIKNQILLESIVLTIVAGMVGVASASGIIWGVNELLLANPSEDMMMINPSVNVGVVCIALVILVISGLIAGFIPAQQAIKVKPIEALRSE